MRLKRQCSLFNLFMFDKPFYTVDAAPQALGFGDMYDVFVELLMSN